MGLRYSDLVDYDRLDPFKKKALEIFSSTFNNPERLNVKVLTVGETAAVLDLLDYDFMLAFNVEGLGTKNLIADEMYRESRHRKGEKIVNAARYYRYLGQDALAMSVTDLVAVGADPIAYVDAIASGDSKWFDDPERVEQLLYGYRVAADMVGCAIPQGETPTLPDIVYPETLDLVGSSFGIIKPKTRFTYGQKIEEGDIIYGLPSGGICANGVSKAREIAERLRDRYFTKLPSGTTLGEELLRPTPLYVRPIIEMFESGVDLHYISPITGHGWKKIARARAPFTYVIDAVPKSLSLFSSIIKWGENLGFDVSDKENYQVWNMGVFVALIAPRECEDLIVKICEKHKTLLYKLGHVNKGEKKVVIKPKKIVYRLDKD